MLGLVLGVLDMRSCLPSSAHVFHPVYTERSAAGGAGHPRGHGESPSGQLQPGAAPCSVGAPPNGLHQPLALCTAAPADSAPRGEGESPLSHVLCSALRAPPSVLWVPKFPWGKTRQG